MKLLKKLGRYLSDSIAELRKVTWPTKKQTITYSIVVIALSIGVAVLFAVLDELFSQGVSLII